MLEEKTQQDSVTLASGEERPLFVVSLKAACFDASSERILCVKKAGHDRRFELPGGALGHGEEIEVALRRELLEELGWEHPVIYEALGICVAESMSPYPEMVYALFSVIGTEEVSLSQEHSAFLWASTSDIRDLTDRGEFNPALADLVIARWPFGLHARKPQSGRR